MSTLIKKLHKNNSDTIDILPANKKAEMWIRLHKKNELPDKPKSVNCTCNEKIAQSRKTEQAYIQIPYKSNLSNVKESHIIKYCDFLKFKALIPKDILDKFHVERDDIIGSTDNSVDKMIIRDLGKVIMYKYEHKTKDIKLIDIDYIQKAFPLNNSVTNNVMFDIYNNSLISIYCFPNIRNDIKMIDFILSQHNVQKVKTNCKKDIDNPKNNKTKSNKDYSITLGCNKISARQLILHMQSLLEICSCYR